MKKLKNCYPKTNKIGEVISYRFFYTGKDYYTGKPKQYTKTWKIPQGLSAKQIELERKKVEIEFIQECERKTCGTYIQETNITFKEYSNQWLNRILIRNEESYSYYIRAKYSLQILNDYFGNYLLTKISPTLVQRFYDYLYERTYTKEIVTVKKSILELVDKNSLNKTQLSLDCGINRHTLKLANTIGEKISKETATTLSNYFNEPITKYFDIKKQQVKYSKSTNQGIKTILVSILNEAKRQQLIEHNYASNEYNSLKTIPSKEKEIYTTSESKEFVKTLLKETNIKKKLVFALLIFLGLRKSEICGLSWDNINFDYNTISINKSTIYLPEFGIVTKSTKTLSSKRCMSIPNQLVLILQEYKVWYNEQKTIHGDLWVNSNHLFLQDNGKPMNPCTINSWLRDFELKNGFKHIPPHSLRHTCITIQLDAGIPLKVVSKRAGHSSEKITLDIYTHLLQSQDNQAADTLNNYLMEM